MRVEMIKVYNMQRSLLELIFLIASFQLIVSLDKRFEQYEYEALFDFLFASHILRALDDSSLKSCCYRSTEALMNGYKCDFNKCDLYVELKLLQQFLPEEKLGALDILKLMKTC